ncbi:galactose-1-phosphate uridylyltransferase [Candidatus Nitromaritima sp. SCGC AAA799-C22]|nr:galactose-1-phosphate uridylyltransferase [Candidatus Nitromaritima sp. SCGC AAA799-C22]
MSELRKDPILDRWVIISKERGERPQDFPPPDKLTGKGFCPFCAGHEKNTPPEILAYRSNGASADTPGWTLRVVPNKYPALNIEGEVSDLSTGLFSGISGIGSHEVIIECPDHQGELEHLPRDRVTDCFRAFKERLIALKKDSRIQYALIFKNHGEAAGATLEHTHCQLIALPILPELVADEIAGCERHFAANERCIYCDLIQQEITAKQRIVAQNERFVALCPYASRYPFEIWVLPHDHSTRFEETRDRELSDLSDLFKETLLRMRTALKEPPYNFVLHTSPLNGDMEHQYHWHIEIMPKLTKLAGFEQGTGFYINPAPPEDAAEILRNLSI